MQCLVKSAASLAVQSALSFSFKSVHHSSLPTSGDHAATRTAKAAPKMAGNRVFRIWVTIRNLPGYRAADGEASRPRSPCWPVYLARLTSRVNRRSGFQGLIGPAGPAEHGLRGGFPLFDPCRRTRSASRIPPPRGLGNDLLSWGTESGLVDKVGGRPPNWRGARLSLDARGLNRQDHATGMGWEPICDA